MFYHACIPLNYVPQYQPALLWIRSCVVSVLSCCHNLICLGVFFALFYSVFKDTNHIFHLSKPHYYYCCTHFTSTSNWCSAVLINFKDIVSAAIPHHPLYSSGMTDNASDCSSGTGLQTRILSTFLNELDGIVSQDSGEEGVYSSVNLISFICS